MDINSEEVKSKFVMAVMENDTKLALAYLQAGVDPNISIQADQNQYNHLSPLMIAATNDNSELIHHLINAGAEPNWMNPFGATAMIYAASQEKSESVIALLKRNADPNLSKNWGGTALHWAAYHNNKKMAQILLDNNADANIKSAETKKTPSEIATERGHEELSIYLEYASGMWKRKTNSELVHRELPAQDLGITYIYNFKSMTVNKIVQNLPADQTAPAHTTKHFSESGVEKDKVIKAVQEFEKQGGKYNKAKFERALYTITPNDQVPRSRRIIKRRKPGSPS